MVVKVRHRKETVVKEPEHVQTVCIAILVLSACNIEKLGGAWGRG